MTGTRQRAGVAAAVLGCTAAVLAGCSPASGSGPRPAAGGTRPAGGTRTAAGGCAPRVVTGVLPRWARAGFSDPRPRMPYELGRRGEIAAILWKDPLLSPPSKRVNNKILWVSRLPVTYSDLVIGAQRMKDGRPVGTLLRRIVPGGPGPSIINLPAPGCWRLSLRWSGHTDSMDVRYVAGGQA